VTTYITVYDDDDNDDDDDDVAHQRDALRPHSAVICSVPPLIAMTPSPPPMTTTKN